MLEHQLHIALSRIDYLITVSAILWIKQMPDYSPMTVKAQRHFCQTVPLSLF